MSQKENKAILYKDEEGKVNIDTLPTFIQTMNWTKRGLIRNSY